MNRKRGLGTHKNVDLGTWIIPLIACIAVSRLNIVSKIGPTYYMNYYTSISINYGPP